MTKVTCCKYCKSEDLEVIPIYWVDGKQMLDKFKCQSCEEIMDME